METGAGAGRDRADVSLARLEAHLGLVACPERNPATGTDGAGRLGQLRNGPALCPLGGGPSAWRGVSD